MNRVFLGALSALLLAFAGVFWWQGRAETETGAPPPALSLEDDETPDALPSADISGLKGPKPPEATELTREQRRFARYDRDSDRRITRNEMMSTRTAGFKRLDVDGNNLLTFEEWAVATSDKFNKADVDGDLSLSPEEFATTRPPAKPASKCRC